MSGRKFTLEEKLQILGWIDEGHGLKEATARFGVAKATLLRWRSKLAAHGTVALTKQSRNTSYPVELKTEAVRAYLAGEGSQDTICRRYGIRNRIQLQNWVLKYTQGEVLKSGRELQSHEQRSENHKR